MDDEKREEYDFVREQIKKMPVDKKKRVLSLVWAVVLAAVFGLVAALVFCLSRPAIEKQMSGRGQQVSLSQEDPEEETALEPDPVVITETKEMDLADYQVLRNQLYAVGKTANQSVVAVTGVKNGTDWFDSEYESEGLGSGVVIAQTSQSYLILSERKLIEDASEIEVSFYDGTAAAATLLAYDGNTGIAVLNVDKRNLPEGMQEKVTVAELGNSHLLSPGTMLVAVGSPLGSPFSILPGNVTSADGEVTTADANYSVITTDIASAQNSSGVLINLDGKIVGVIMQDYGRSEYSQTVTALGITDLRAMVEMLSNGNAPSYLGLEISTVTDEISREYQLPRGVYIKNVEEDSPAMSAGIQTGDVLVRAGQEEIQTEEQYIAWLRDIRDGQEVKLVVKRMGSDGAYQDVTLTATADVLD